MSNLPVALLVITDRPAYYERAMASAAENLPDNFGCRIAVNDERHVLGFAGAIQRGWNRVIESGCRWVFHLEDDFTFNAPVDVGKMVEALEMLAPQRVAQLSLKRQPWNDAERAAGGIVEMDPASYTEWPLPVGPVTLHRNFFTTNPSLYSAELCERGWPQEPRSEGVFTHQLLADGYQFGIWGGKFDPPAVEHIGTERAGVGY